MAFKSNLSLAQYNLLRLPEKIKYAKCLVDYAVQLAAKEFDVFIIVKPTNIAAYPLLLSGMVPKVKEITARTCSNGLFQGYIIEKSISEIALYTYIPLVKREQATTWQAIRRNSKDLWIKYDQINKDDVIIKALANNCGQYVTSDIDVLLIGTNDQLESKMIYDYDYGHLTAQELEIIRKINENYSKMTHTYAKERQKMSMICHGPYNRHIKSLKKELQFPVQIFLPTTNEYSLLGSHGQIDQSIHQLQNFLRQQTNNFDYYIPEHWN